MRASRRRAWTSYEGERGVDRGPQESTEAEHVGVQRVR